MVLKKNNYKPIIITFKCILYTFISFLVTFTSTYTWVFLHFWSQLQPQFSRWTMTWKLFLSQTSPGKMDDTFFSLNNGSSFKTRLQLNCVHMYRACAIWSERRRTVQINKHVAGFDYRSKGQNQSACEEPPHSKDHDPPFSHLCVMYVNEQHITLAQKAIPDK